MIVRPENMDFTQQKFSAIIYGSPGIGKTTLACSAPNPILIDFDHGVSRVRADHRVPTIVASNYEEVLADVKSPEIAEFDTIIIDTGGSFVTYLKDWAFRVKGAKTRNGEFNGLKGFGFVKSEFANFTNYIKTVLNKNIIYVFHTDEKADKDGNPIQRLVCEGSVRNTVWNSCEFGGYLQMLGNNRTLCFSPEQEFFAKGTHGITGKYNLPVLDDKTPNTFMTQLFEMAKKNIQQEKEYFAPVREAYEKLMAQIGVMVNAVTDIETANKAAEEIPKLEHVLTSKQEAAAMLKDRTELLGLRYSRDKGYVLNEE